MTERKNQPVDEDDSEAIERVALTSPVYDTWTGELWLQRLEDADADAGAGVDVSGMDIELGTDPADLGTTNAEREGEISTIETPRLTSSLPLPATTQTSSVQAPQPTQEPTDTQASSEAPVSTGPQKRKLSAEEYKAIRDEMQAKLAADVRAMEKRRDNSHQPLWFY